MTMQAPQLAGLTTAGRLPRGPHGIGREEIAATQRQRMLSAALELLADKGLATTVADITAKARVSRKTFYDQFADRTDCLLVAHDLCNDALLQHVVEAGARPGATDPIDQLQAAVSAYLDFLAANPTLARAALVEGATVGTRAVEHCAQVRRRLADLLKAWHQAARRHSPDLPAVRDTAYLALSGAMHELAFQHAIAGQTEQLRELEPAIMDACRALLNLPR